MGPNGLSPDWTKLLGPVQSSLLRNAGQYIARAHTHAGGAIGCKVTEGIASLRGATVT